MSDGIVVSGGRRLSRAALEERALRAATGLQTLGVGPGDRVAILLRNDFPFFEASRAASALGASPVAVNWHLAPPEIAYVLCDSGAKAVIAHQDLVARLHGALPTGVPLFTVSTPPEICAAYGIDPGPADAWPDERDWSDWLESHAPLAEIRRGFIETMTYTSGTTGRPKGVVRFAQTLEASKAFLATRDRLYGIAPGIRALIAGPMYHAAPNAFAMRALTAADRIVSMPRFEAKEFLALVERHRITNAFLVPTMLVRLLRLPRDVRRRHDLSSLSHVLVAAAPCPPDVKAAALDWLGPIVHEFYGGTEVGYVSYCSPQDARRKPGTVGRLMDGVTARILDEDGREVPATQSGEIYCRFAHAPDFTYANGDDARRTMEKDGLLATGDVGYFDDEGYLFLCDRAKDMVISGGVNIYPAEIETALLAMPGVRDAAVFGLPDPEYGEVLVAAIQPEPAAKMDAEQVAAYLRTRLAGFKVPRRIDFHADLPRDDAGKIYKRRLRARYLAEARSEGGCLDPGECA